MSVFTSNVSTNSIIYTPDNNKHFDENSSGYSFRLYSDTKNIPSNSNIQYGLWKGSQNYSSYLSASNTVTAKNNVNSSISISSSLIPLGDKYILSPTNFLKYFITIPPT